MLSILICTLESRREQFEKLNSFLEKQIEANNCGDNVEILVYEDNREMPVGYKRNRLIEEANGDFICFIDDDDWVANNYIANINTVLVSNPDIDCVGFKGLLVSKALGDKEFIHTTRVKRYFEDANYYYRPPNHLNPMRRKTILPYKFPEINFGEDADWAMRICNADILRKEVFIDNILYYYYWEPNKSATFPQKPDLSIIGVEDE